MADFDDFDLDPLLRDLARDAARRAQLADVSAVRRSGDHRRFAKGVGVAAGLVLVTTGTFGLMTKGGGAGIIASSVAASGGTVGGATSDRTAWVSPTDVVVPPAPSWVPQPPTAPNVPTTPGAIPAPGPGTSSSGASSSSGSSTAKPPVATGSTAGPTATPSTPSTTRPTSPSSPATPTTPAPKPSTTKGTTTTKPTPPAGTTAAPTTPRPTSASTPTASAAASTPTTQAPLTSYTVTLYNAVAGGRVGERIGSAAGFGAPSGTLPYAHRVATTAVGSVGSAVNRPTTVTVGVGTDGAAHVTLFTDGKATADRIVPTNLSDAAGLVAAADPASRQVTVLVFRAGGTVSRLVLGDVTATTPPKLVAQTTVLTTLPGVTAATLADATGGTLRAYVAAGDRLLLVQAPAAGAASMTQLVARGLAGTTTLGRLTAGAGGGVVAWTAAGAGTAFYGANPYGPLTPGGSVVALPR